MLIRLLVLVAIPFLCWAETVSVIVPCYYKHFSLLPELLKNISRQTVLPEEVVISVSECDKIDMVERAKVESMRYPFKVVFLFHTERKFAGENRNCACKVAKGDIFITQDSDDIPHAQRIEVIKYMFSHHDVMHVMHTFTYPYQTKGGPEDTLLNPRRIRTFLITSKLRKYWRAFGRPTNGEIGIRRKVFEKIQWSERQTGEDTEFNERVVTAFKKTLLIDAKLLIYRRHLSSNVTDSGRSELEERLIQ